MTNKDLVYIVNAGNDGGMASMSNDYSFPALGVLALGTWLQNRMPDVEVLARDGAVRTNEQIQEEIAHLNPVLVGVSTLCTSYQNSLDIAKTARGSGAKVVFGNDQASQTSKLILENQPNVDYVIGAEYGELPLEMLVRNARGENIPLDKIPSLTYRKDGQVVGFDFNNPTHKSALSITSPFSGYNGIILEQRLRTGRRNVLDIFPIVDRNLYPEDHWKTYLKNYLNKFSGLHKQPVLGVTTMNRARGCNRQNEDKCKHCDMLLDISSSSPEMFWEEVKSAYGQVRATSFYEACDSFSSFPGLIKKIVEAKPSNLGFNPEFYVYAQAIDLARHPERVDMLKEMGVFRVNIGLEAMSDRTLRHMKGEKDSVENNYRALELLKDRGIHVYGSFVLGSEAETPETLRETTEKVCGLIRDGYLCDAEAQPVLPLHGNYQGRVLRSYGLMHGDSQHPDWPLDVEDLAKIYIDRFSGVNHRDCVESAKTIRETAKRFNINFGSGVSREDSYK
jgi:radical SAM superfamily enzyme YgiQ (UPF0313 family)